MSAISIKNFSEANPVELTKTPNYVRSKWFAVALLVSSVVVFGSLAAIGGAGMFARMSSLPNWILSIGPIGCIAMFSVGTVMAAMGGIAGLVLLVKNQKNSTPLIVPEKVEPQDPAKAKLNAISLASLLRNDENAALQLLQSEPIDYTFKNSKGQTLLHLAVDPELLDENHSYSEQRKALIEQLLSRPDLDPNAYDTSGNTSLHYLAASALKEEAVIPYFEAFLACDRVDVNSQQKDKSNVLGYMKNGNTALHLVIKNSSWSSELKMQLINRLLARQGIEINSECYGTPTPLIEAVKIGDVSIVSALLNKNANIGSNYQQTPAIHLAAELGFVEIFRILLNKDKDLRNCRDNIGLTPLHYAARHGYVEIVEQLLPFDDLEVNAMQSFLLDTPLHKAVYKGDNKIVELLLGDKRVDPNKKDRLGETPFHLALMDENEKMAMLFLENPDLDVNAREDGAGGMYPLQLAAAIESETIVTDLLKREALEINAQNTDGETALHHAVETGNLSILKLLLADRRLDTTIKNAKGQTALDLATDPQIKQLFEDAKPQV